MRRSRSRLKIRETAIALIAVMALMLAVVIPASASAVSLKHNTMIDGNVITLGDVFSGLEKYSSERVLGPAPRPGSEMTLNARTLLRVAVAMDLPWRPTSNSDFIVLSRAATVVDTDLIKASLKEALSNDGMSGNFDVAIVSGPREIILPYDETRNVEITDLRFNRDQNRFDAVLVAPSKDNPLTREKISGTIQRLVEVPTLRHPMKNGDVISKKDLDFVNMRAEFLKHDMVLSANELIGSTPRRIVLAGKPIKEGEIQPPQIVQRGELVTMVYKNGSLNLTAQAKALQNGAKGEIIRVVNAGSNQTLEAMVSGYREVIVQDF